MFDDWHQETVVYSLSLPCKVQTIHATCDNHEIL